MSKVSSLLEVQKNIFEINYLPTELMMMMRNKNVMRYIQLMEACQEKHQFNFQKIGLCIMEKYCPNEYVRFFECKAKNNNNECFNQQVDLEICMKPPIYQLINLSHKAKSY